MNRRRRTKGPLSPIRLFAIVAIVLLTVVYFITKTRTDQPQGEKNSNNAGQCLNDCSGNGLCEKDNKCVCDWGFKGEDCSTPVILENKADRERMEVFDTIFEKSFWQSEESVSGRGSELKQTVEVRNIVQTVASKYNVRSLLDVPCGDLNWMRKVEFEHEVEYIGGDIVRGLIKFDRERFGNTSRKFIVMDMVSQQPYKPFDLIVTRDAFVHLPDRQVKKIIDNFNKSGSKYLLTTLFPDHDPWNIDKPGQWRQINLLKEPYNFPQPVELFNEKYWGTIDLSKPYFNDKSLGLWKLPLPLPNIPDEEEENDG
jgi:hypothetical protein